MTGTVDTRASAISALMCVADDFAARALAQEASRDRARPGTGVHHLYAHSATLWRQAEGSIRSRIRELELGSARASEADHADAHGRQYDGQVEHWGQRPVA